MTQKKTILSKLFLVALATTRSLAVNPEICNSDSSKCYKLYTDEETKVSSEEARVACNGMGHDLAYFETKDEYEAFLTAAADAQNTGDKEVWVNGYRISGVPNDAISFEAKLSDSSTKPFDDLYHSWAPGQPNNNVVTIFSQDCIEVRFDDTDTTFFQNMNDVRCGVKKSSYACVRTEVPEVPPEVPPGGVGGGKFRKCRTKSQKLKSLLLESCSKQQEQSHYHQPPFYRCLNHQIHISKLSMVSSTATMVNATWSSCTAKCLSQALASVSM